MAKNINSTCHTNLTTTLLVLAGVFALICFSSGNCLAAEPDGEIPALRKAVEHLSSRYGEKYPGGPGFLKRLDDIDDPASDAFVQLRREALLANPLVSENPIVFVTRSQYINEHGTEATMYQPGEINTRCFRGGGALKLVELPSGKVTALVNLPEGVVRDPEVHFDGGKILFSMRKNAEDCYHLYEIGADGKDLRQLTFAERISDIQPVYMPDGSIIFSSTRDPKYIPCQRHLMANLFRMNSDGSNIHQIGFNTQFEGRASLMPDGRLLYTRWEYVDKHYSSAYGLWTVNPDGTDHALYYGNYAWQPGAITDGRIIPGTRKFICIFTSVHDLGWGAVVIADRSRGLDGLKPIVKSWPADMGPYLSKWDTEERIGMEFDRTRRLPIKYETPYPLSKDFFLCSRQVKPRGPMGLFLLDTFGNEILLHEESPGCFDPIPLAPRKRPPVVLPKVDLAKNHGTFYVHDVYTGMFMDHVARGSVKFLRVVEAPSKRAFPNFGIGDWAPWGSSDSHHPVALNWNHFNNKRILGTVPVEKDGSACFKVPAGRFVYFQLLDENGMMVHSMRSGTMIQPGEEKGCIGCHEDHLSPQQAAPRMPLALKREPSELNGWYGPPRKFSYTTEVQPVLDRHCVGCHDYDKEAKELNLSGDKGIVFSASYTNLLRTSPPEWIRPVPGAKKPLVCSVGAGPVKVLEPYTWGSHRSRLIDMLRGDHYKVKLSREELARIVTWIDLNVPYYPSHITYYGANTAGRSPLDHADLAELGRLISDSPKGKDLGWSKVNEYTNSQIAHVMTDHGEPVNFTRPEKSLCLSGFAAKDAPGYQRALALIRKGQSNLKEHPRADMPGFKPCPAHQARLDHLANRRRIEQANRQAIIKGEKLYDK